MCLKGKLLEDSSEKMNSINLLKHMTPIAAVVLMLMVMVMEPDITDSIPRYGSPSFPSFAAIMLLNGFLSFLVNLSNFLVTNFTSPLTLQVRPGSEGFCGALPGCLSVLTTYIYGCYIPLLRPALTYSDTHYLGDQLEPWELHPLVLYQQTCSDVLLLTREICD